SDGSYKTFSRLEIAATLIMYKVKHKISANAIDDICSFLRLLGLQQCPPKDETPRLLEKYLKFKEGEERLVLLFGFEAFQNFLLKDYYEHQLLFVMAVHKAENRSISPIDMVEIKELLTQYYHQFPKLYGKRQNVQSAHSTYHMYQSVRDYGKLPNYSTFNFESILGLITRTINATKNHSLEIQNTLNLFRLAWPESESDELNKTL
ncbi:unnamed protein product, partial [Didymodactylos carnosus]